ncbi:hypothetical protein D3C72_2531500 [compost metagenome]
MLLPHVQDMNLGNFAVQERQIQHFTRRLGMNVNLDGLVIGDDDDGIAVHRQRFPKFVFVET